MPAQRALKITSGSFSNQADTISELTSNAGVTVDGVLLKDGASYARVPVGAFSSNGAVSIPSYSADYFVTKAGVCALTIADPTSGTHDGVELTFISTTAQAHTLSNAAGSGFNNGGSAKDIGTFGGAIGDRITIVAYQGKWYVKDSLNVTLA